jgi:hypothetical protein
MSLVLQSSGGGSVTLQEPVTASNLTITVPAVTGTMLTTASTGTVLQVVNFTTQDGASSSSSTYADTALVASITPSSATSKILVFVTLAGIGKLNNTRAAFRLLRNSTTLRVIEGNAAWDNATGYNYVGGSGITYLDNPATTSSTSYKVQIASTTNESFVIMNADLGTSSLTLMEIAQ